MRERETGRREKRGRYSGRGERRERRVTVRVEGKGVGEERKSQSERKETVRREEGNREKRGRQSERRGKRVSVGERREGDTE